MKQEELFIIGSCVFLMFVILGLMLLIRWIF